MLVQLGVQHQLWLDATCLNLSEAPHLMVSVLMGCHAYGSLSLPRLPHSSLPHIGSFPHIDSFPHIVSIGSMPRLSPHQTPLCKLIMSGLQLMHCALSTHIDLTQQAWPTLISYPLHSHT